MPTASDGPVHRFLGHAMPAGVRETADPAGVRLRMRGRIKVGTWLRFEADWSGNGRGFEWQARAGLGRLRPLRVLDRLESGQAVTEVRLGGRRIARADDQDTLRSAAGRTAVEAAVWAPSALALNGEVSWKAESDRRISLSWAVPPEQPRVALELDEAGAVQTAVVDRWRAGEGYVPCGCEVRAERRFGDLVLPTGLTVGWWFGTPRWEPFFECEVVAAEPAADRDVGRSGH